MVQERESAKRMFAFEFNKVNFQYKESEDKFAPNYVLVPSGGKVNRVFMVGTLVEQPEAGGEAGNERFRGKIADPTGSYIVHASRQYQPIAAQALADIVAPCYVAIIAKPYVYKTDEGKLYPGLRPESIVVTDEATYNRWVNETIVDTLTRLEGKSNPTPDAAKAFEHYQTDLKEFKTMLLTVLGNAEKMNAALTVAGGKLQMEVETAKSVETPAPMAEKADNFGDLKPESPTKKGAKSKKTPA